MTRMWRVITLAVLLLGIAGILRLYWVGFVWKNGLSLETTVVLFVGLIAFLAVMIQLEAERSARAEETERQKRAVATALLFEIDSFYRLHVRETHESLKRWNPTTGDLFAAKSISPQPFPVYDGNACVLGSLEEGLVFDIVEFYGAAAQYLSALRDYRVEFERCRCDTALAGTATDDSPAREAMARSLLVQLQKGLPHLINFAFLASKKLCEETHLEFRAPIISVAAENLSVAGIAGAQQGTNAQAH